MKERSEELKAAMQRVIDIMGYEDVTTSTDMVEFLTRVADEYEIIVNDYKIALKEENRTMDLLEDLAKRKGHQFPRCIAMYMRKRRIMCRSCGRRTITRRVRCACGVLYEDLPNGE